MFYFFILLFVVFNYCKYFKCKALWINCKVNLNYYNKITINKVSFKLLQFCVYIYLITLNITLHYYIKYYKYKALWINCKVK